MHWPVQLVWKIVSLPLMLCLIEIFITSDDTSISLYFKIFIIICV